MAYQNQNRNHNQNRGGNQHHGGSRFSGSSAGKQNNAPTKQDNAPVKQNSTMPKAGTLLTLTDENGNEYQFDILSSWSDFSTRKHYILYTDHDIDIDGNEQLFAAICKPTGSDFDILPVETEADWASVDAMIAKLR